MIYLQPTQFLREIKAFSEIANIFYRRDNSLLIMGPQHRFSFLKLLERQELGWLDGLLVVSL